MHLLMHSVGVLYLDLPKYLGSKRGSLSLTHCPSQPGSEAVVDVVLAVDVVVVVVVVVDVEVVVVVPIVVPPGAGDVSALLGGRGLGGGMHEKAKCRTKKATSQRLRGIGLGSPAIFR